jgi:hypothetical protein
VQSTIDDASVSRQSSGPGLTAGVIALSAAFVTLTSACFLADTEPRPPTAEAAVTEARQTLSEIGESTLATVPYTTDEWVAPNGCDTHPDIPEQGDVGRVIFRRYPSLPGGISTETLLADQESRWSAAGHSVGRGGPAMPAQVITRTNGIGYALVSVPPGVELRAFVQCY